ncbi:MAG: gfo/Idh/MocA family oxidoreductase, partial [Ferruginibacter sp.]|nr:gfo/Idh/MocA family oxidoreductase [Ferruginibacter sp.]
MQNRRKFLHQTSLLVGAGTLASAFESKAFSILNNGISPSDQLNIGAIGISGMGWSNVKAALKVPGVNLVAVCDIDKNAI